MSVIYLQLIIISVIDGVLINNEVLINLKIKSAQSFRYAHKNRVYVFIRSDCSYVYEYLSLCIVFHTRRKKGLESATAVTL
jgi:hypothetical protein